MNKVSVSNFVERKKERKQAKETEPFWLQRNCRFLPLPPAFLFFSFVAPPIWWGNERGKQKSLQKKRRFSCRAS